MSLTIFDNTFQEESYTVMDDFTNQFGNLSAVSLNAFKDTNGNVYSLNIGASSNLHLEAADTTKSFSSSNGVEFYVTTVNELNVRTDTEILNIRPSLVPGYTLIDAGNRTLNLDVDFAEFANFNTIYFNTSNASSDIIGTNKANLVIASELHTTSNAYFHEPVYMNSNVYFNAPIHVNSNLISYGHLFAKDVNFFRTSNVGSVEKTIGYGFTINDQNQLELVKVGRFLEEGSTEPITVTKKVAIFGYNDITSNEDTNTTQYLVFNEMGEIGTNDSNGNFSPVDTVDTSKLPLAGGVMEGDINMNGFAISNVVIVGELQGIMKTSGDTLTGDINMNTNDINNVNNLQVQNLKTNQEDNIIHVYDHIVPATDGDIANITLGNATTFFNKVYSTSIYTSNLYGDINMNQYSLSNGSTATFNEFITSGADYAEYMQKENIDDVFVPGEVIGINSNGNVTKSFNRSIHFGIISDDAGVIGGNKEGIDINKCVIVSFCGRIKISKPIGASTGDYIIPTQTSEDSIYLTTKKISSITLKQYINSIGHIITCNDDGTCMIIIKH